MFKKQMDRFQQIQQAYSQMSSSERQAFGETLQEIPFDIAKMLLERGSIVTFRIDTQKQENVQSGNTLVTLIGTEG
jgi:hypothetical protein